MNIKIPTEKEIEQSEIAVKVLTYCSCLMMAHFELVECLISEGKFKHTIKHRVKQLGVHSDNVYKECCRVFLGEDSYLCDGFGNKSGQLFTHIKNNVGFSGSEKWYQIICSLSRLIEQQNEKLEFRIRFYQAKYLYNAEDKLSDLKYESNHIVDRIIKN